MQEVKIKDVLAFYKARQPRPSIVKKSGSVKPWCGLDCVFVDDKDIKALMDGKTLYFDDGEYAHLIVRLEQ